VVVVAEERERLRGDRRGPVGGVGVAADLDEAAVALELDGAVAAVERRGDPLGDEVEGDVAVLRAQVREVVEHGGLDGLEQAADLHARLLVALAARAAARSWRAHRLKPVR
jgi:hypothetical protein